jgi:hypothetical protein
MGGKSSPPPAPNPVDTARASTSTNVATSIANAMLNNTNQNTPEGSLRYDQSGNYNWHDPYTNLDVSIPTFTATQTRSPQAQAIEDQNQAAKMNLAGMANVQSSRLSKLLGNEMNLSGAPASGDPNQITGIQKAATTFADAGQQQSSLGDYGRQQSSFGNVPGATFGFGDAGDITKSYGPQDDFSSDRQRVEDSLMSRMNPQLARERSNIETRLADQGIRYGSQAYASAMDDYNRQATDTRFGAIAQAGGEQQRMMDMAAQRAGFQNAAQQQEYNQQQGRGAFYNAAQQQTFGQEQARGQFANEAQQRQYEQTLGAGQFANQAQRDTFQQAAARGEFQNAGLAQQVAQGQAGFNAQNMARNQWMNEQYAQRNQPINEISSLLSGSQINNPNFVNTPNNQIPTTDVAGLINTRFSQDMDIYKQESTNQNALMGGIMGMVGGMMKMSDERVKNVGPKMATVFAAGEDGERQELPIYAYSYKGDPESTQHIGPMAQDVEKIDKRAVKKDQRGIRHINTGMVMGSILKAA